MIHHYQSLLININPIILPLLTIIINHHLLTSTNKQKILLYLPLSYEIFPIILLNTRSTTHLGRVYEKAAKKQIEIIDRLQAQRSVRNGESYGVFFVIKNGHVSYMVNGIEWAM